MLRSGCSLRLWHGGLPRFRLVYKQVETRTGRRRTEEDRAMRYGGSNGGAGKLLGRGRKREKKKKIGDSELVLGYHVERNDIY
jgi:hypothetical protein